MVFGSFYHTVTGILFCRAVKRTVSASAPLPLVSATVEAGAPTFQDKRVFQWRPPAATYLCREAAKARFDNRTNHRVGFPKGRGFLRGEGNRNPSPLEWRFWLLLSLLTKVTRRRQKRAGQRPAPTHYADLSAAGCPFVELSIMVQSPVSISSIR